MKDIPALSRAEKKVIAKVMVKEGNSATSIEKWLGISDNTIHRSVTAETPEELKEFENNFKEAIKKKKAEGLGLAQKRMLELIPKYQRLDHLVKASEYFEGKGKDITAIEVDGSRVRVINYKDA